MRTHRPRLLAGLLGMASIAACQGETTSVVASTQLLVSIDFAPALRSQADRLRATVWTHEGSTWNEGSSVTVSTEKLSWPLDLPVVPSRPEHENAEVELVLDALSGGTVLAETRVLSRFVADQHRTLRTLLALCTGKSPGFVCAEAGCHGDSCTVCAPDGACVPVVAVTAEEAALDAGGLPGPRDASADGRSADVVRGDTGAANPGSEAGGEPGLPGSSAPDAGAPASCPVDHGCNPAYPCVPTALGYTCRGQLADWPMPDGFDSAKYKPSYTSDGVTVIDNVTHLEWETNVPSVLGDCTRFTETTQGGSAVTKGPPGELCSISEGRAHCDKLVLAGKDDWRLPSMIELASLLDHSRVDSRYGIDLNFFPDVEWSEYITGSPYVSAPASFHAVDMIQRSTWETTEGKLRCVRGGAEPPFARPRDRYTVDSAADTVTDNATKLIWQRSASPTAFLGDAPALDTYCQGDFRIPSPNELLTLVDLTRQHPALDPLVFPNTPSAKFWTLDNGRGGAISFANGDLGIYVEGDAGYVRCVR